MKRFKAIVRCMYHALLPVFAERLIYGSCHYKDVPGQESVSWLEHCALNMSLAFELMSFKVLDADTRSFHKMD